MNYIQTEAALENDMIKTLIGMGYENISIPDEATLLSNFKNKISEHNLTTELNGIPLSDSEFERLLNELQGKGVFNSAYNLRQKQVITRDDGSKAYIELINKNKWCHNIFQVTNQITVNARRVNRYDVTILINGLPLVQIELKRRGMELKQAFNQINRYKSESYTGLFKYVQIFVISNGVSTKYISNDETKLNYNFAFKWTDENNQDIQNIAEFTRDFLSPCQLAKTISRYMITNKQEKKLMVMRPYQIYAVEKLMERATETKKNGYVWHTTGSGKTLTSFKLAQLLSDLPDVEKVVFLVDRKDLNAQTVDEFNKFQIEDVVSAKSTYDLTKQFNDDSVSLIISTIQKMNNAIKKPSYAKKMEKFREKRVIFIIDECHRSQFGDMHKEIKKHFNQAQYFGFTGTPIFEAYAGDGLATGNLFGKQAHTYLIKNGIHDKNVLGFKVDYFKTMSMSANATDDDVENIDTKEVLESDERTILVVDQVLKIHPIKTHQQTYNALFVAPNIHMAVKYYQQFKKANHNLVISSIFSYAPNAENHKEDKLQRDMLEDIIKDYNGKFQTNYSTDTYASYFRDVSKRFKNKEIDILIVVDMFLTGYDSKLLNTLYIDKKLKMHNLIQAFSRTNRIHTEKKMFGNIVSFATRKADVEEAIRVYSDTDNTDVVVLQPYQDYIDLAYNKVQELLKIVPTVSSVDALESENEQKEFITAYRSLVHTIIALQNFIEFEFNEDDIGISKQTYEDYRSKYLDLNRRVAQTDKTSILVDVSFDMELISTDIINVDYILELLSHIDYSDHKQRKLGLEHLKKILDRNDSKDLHSKIELLRKFIEKEIPTIHDGNVIEERYESFLEKEKNEIIYNMSAAVNIGELTLKEMINEYQYTSIIPNEKIRENVKGKYLEKNRTMNQIKEFIVEVSELY